MSVTATVPQESVWKRWRFTSLAALRKALEEYTALAMAQYTRGQTDGSDPDPETMDTEYRLMAQNREIDRRMLLLGRVAPLYCRILDGYFLSGLCCQAKGWEVTASRVGMPHFARRHRDVFEEVVSECVRELFHVTETRS